MYVGVRACVCVRTYTHTLTYIGTYIRVCPCVYMYACVCTYVRTYIRTYVCMFYYNSLLYIARYPDFSGKSSLFIDAFSWCASKCAYVNC